MEKKEFIETVNYWMEKVVRDTDFEFYSVTDVTINTRARRWMGRCRKHTIFGVVDWCKLDFAAALLQMDNDSILNTILHEIAHTVVGSNGHDLLWWKAVNTFSHLYGMKIGQYASQEETVKLHQFSSRWVIKCKHCGATWERFTKSSIVKGCLKGRCTCGCGSHEFDVQHIEGV